MRVLMLSAILLSSGLLATPLLAQDAGGTTRVTAGARTALRMLASIKVGAVEVTYERGEDRKYSRRYREVAPPEEAYGRGGTQGSDPAREAEIAAEIARLAPFADKDGSGAVTAPEGLQFRRVLEFGMMAAWVSRTEETVEVKRLAPLLAMSPDELRRNVRDYEALRERLGGYDSHLYPALPILE
jgi:hypothetical protein